MFAGAGSTGVGEVALLMECLRATAWCDFLVCDRARVGMIGASVSLDAFD